MDSFPPCGDAETHTPATSWLWHALWSQRLLQPASIERMKARRSYTCFRTALEMTHIIFLHIPFMKTRYRPIKAQEKLGYVIWLRSCFLVIILHYLQELTFQWIIRCLGHIILVPRESQDFSAPESKSLMVCWGKKLTFGSGSDKKARSHFMKVWEEKIPYRI